MKNHTNNSEYCCNTSIVATGILYIPTQQSNYFACHMNYGLEKNLKQFCFAKIIPLT